ncbi:MAG: hypothetical protein KJ749_14130 [Planctomycetes bacterium]|nr:hypothetical protein [Planctomycetota bacterium]
MISRSIEVLTLTGGAMFIGTLALLAATVMGWVIGRHRQFPLVRLVGWWLDRVILPLLRSPFWWQRAGTILLNNTCVLAALVGAAQWRWGGQIGVAGLGLSLGLGLRHLSTSTDALTLPASTPGTQDRIRMQVGLALNLLEPAAIIIALGLSLGMQAIPLSPGQAWETFAVWVVPALTLAAAGEGMWLGIGRDLDVMDKTEQPTPEDAEHPDSD